MDDTSVFRRFFVITNLIAELMQSFGGAMGGGAMGGVGGASEPDNDVGSAPRRTTVQKYGADPFSPPIESPMPDMNEQINTSQNFP